MRPPTRADDSYTVEAIPWSRRTSAAVNPEMPAPTIAMRAAGGEAPVHEGLSASVASAALPPAKKPRRPMEGAGFVAATDEARR